MIKKTFNVACDDLPDEETARVLEAAGFRQVVRWTKGIGVETFTAEEAMRVASTPREDLRLDKTPPSSPTTTRDRVAGAPVGRHTVQRIPMSIANERGPEPASSIDAILASYKPGQRVAAAMEIHYADMPPGFRVDVDELGTILEADETPAGVSLVLWDRTELPAHVSARATYAQRTSNDALRAVDAIGERAIKLGRALRKALPPGSDPIAVGRMDDRGVAIFVYLDETQRELYAHGVGRDTVEALDATIEAVTRGPVTR